MFYRQPLPKPEAGQLSNELDKFIRLTRETELAALLDDMQRIKERDPGPAEIFTELGTMNETLKAQAVEVSQPLALTLVRCLFCIGWWIYYYR